MGRRALRARPRGRARAVLGPGATVELVGATPAARRAARAGAAPARAAARRRPAPRRPATERARSTRSTPSSSSSSATPTASPTPPRSRSPSCPARPTTRSSSRPARRRQDPPAALDRQLRARLRRRADASATRRSRRFTNEFLAALHGGDVDRFKAPLPRNDVLLIDDVQFLESKVKTEEEFFHTFNALHETGSQLVLTSDRLPRDLARARGPPARALRVRPRRRHPPPDLATRLTVLRKRVHHDGIELADDGVLDADRRARRPTTSAPRGRADPRRRLRLAHRPADRRRARRPRCSTGSIAAQRRAARRRPAARSSASRPSPASTSASPARSSLSPSRARPRRLAPAGRDVPRARAHGRDAPGHRPRSFGGRDHSTVLHACRRAAERIAADPTPRGRRRGSRAPLPTTRRVADRRPTDGLFTALSHAHVRENSRTSRAISRPRAHVHSPYDS